MRFGSLQRIWAALYCPGLPASDDPASTLAAALSPTLPVAAGVLAVFVATRRLRLAVSRWAPPPCGSFAGCFLHSGVPGPPGADCGLAGRLGVFSRQRSWDFHPSQGCSGCPGCDRFGPISRPHAVFTADQSRALAFGFLSRERFPLAGGTEVWRRRLLGFGPVNQPYHVDRRPRYSFQKGRSIAQAFPAMGFGSSCRSSDAIPKP